MYRYGGFDLLLRSRPLFGGQKFGGKGKEFRQTYKMSNRYKGIMKVITKGLILFWIMVSIV